MSDTQIEDNIAKPSESSCSNDRLMDQPIVDHSTSLPKPPDPQVISLAAMCSALENSQNKRSKLINSGPKPNQRTTKMRPPQQPGVPRKLPNRSFHLRSGKPLAIADVENNCNVKNQQVYRKQHAPKNIKQNFHKVVRNRAAAQFALRSKFFLPAKRPRKEIIIPPTKFLLGGNISDPLNLNGLQDESLNTTPNQTPQQSPITTPPKVEVIIPPNIYDPLHLLDPVDSVEYEKQLVSPMKRRAKPKHRNRKKKTKRRRTKNSENAPISSGTAALPTTATTFTDILKNNQQTSVDDNSTPKAEQVELREKPEKNSGTVGDSGDVNVDKTVSKDNNNETGCNVNVKNEIEKPSRDLRLDLSDINSESVLGGAGRKRRISEGLNKNNNSKFRRMDSMDKIVSPVIPQPGAWKRPPRTVPTGARKSSRLRSTSVSESELVSPTDEMKTMDTSTTTTVPREISEIHRPNIAEQQKQPEKVPPKTSQPTKQEQQQAAKLPKFKPEGARYQYGNFDRYSGYRNINDLMDVRLQVFHRHAHLFRGKDILDIGCNAGHITMAVAKDLGPKTITGLDIDRHLIMRARRNLSLNVVITKCETVTLANKNVVAESNTNKSEKQVDDSKKEETAGNAEQQESKDCQRDIQKPVKTQPEKNLNSKRKSYQKMRAEREKEEFFPISFPITYGGIPDNPCMRKDNFSPEQPAEDDPKFPKNVFFRVANYVLKDESLINNEPQQYDVILCLSVTKWIHLNFGDAGLKLAFKRMFNQLRPGGKLILEAQNWASYKKKKSLTETIYNNYKSIEFFPNKFHEYLLGSEVGFSHSYCLGAPRHMNKGFSRPIQLYAKGDYTPNHIRWSDNYHPQTPYETYRGIYAGMVRPRYPAFETPRGNSGSYSCRQTPGHPNMPTSQYYNPFESDSYLPSYDTEIQNHHYVFASPLYQTIWSPPANLRNSSANKTPLFGSIREVVDGEDGAYARHVYPPNDCGSSPRTSCGSAFNSIREPDPDDQLSQTNRRHVYATNDGSGSPLAVDSLSSPRAQSTASLSPGINQQSNAAQIDTPENNIIETNDVDTANGDTDCNSN